MEGYIGEVRMFVGNFAPQNWLFCDGQKLPIQQYQALYTIIGTAFGGDGATFFNLPDFRSRVPMHRGQGTGLSNHNIGQQLGSEAVTLTSGQLPAHSHIINAASAIGNVGAASGGIIASTASPAANFVAGPADVTLSAKTVTNTGQGQSHPNIQPSLVASFIVCVQGDYPMHP